MTFDTVRTLPVAIVVLDRNRNVPFFPRYPMAGQGKGVRKVSNRVHLKRYSPLIQGSYGRQRLVSAF